MLEYIYDRKLGVRDANFLFLIVFKEPVVKSHISITPYTFGKESFYPKYGMEVIFQQKVIRTIVWIITMQRVDLLIYPAESFQIPVKTKISQ